MNRNVLVALLAGLSLCANARDKSFAEAMVDEFNKQTPRMEWDGVRVDKYTSRNAHNITEWITLPDVAGLSDPEDSLKTATAFAEQIKANACKQGDAEILRTLMDREKLTLSYVLRAADASVVVSFDVPPEFCSHQSGPIGGEIGKGPSYAETEPAIRDDGISNLPNGTVVWSRTLMRKLHGPLSKEHKQYLTQMIRSDFCETLPTSELASAAYKAQLVVVLRTADGVEAFRIPVDPNKCGS